VMKKMCLCVCVCVCVNVCVCVCAHRDHDLVAVLLARKSESKRNVRVVAVELNLAQPWWGRCRRRGWRRHCCVCVAQKRSKNTYNFSYV